MKSFKDNDGLHRHGKNPNWCFAAPGMDGKYHHHSTGTPSKAGAREVRRRYFENRVQGIDASVQSKWTVARASDAWCEYRVAMGKARKTQKYDSVRCTSLKRHLGGRRLGDITAADIRFYQAHRRREVRATGRVPEGSRGLRSINVELQVLRTIMVEAGCGRVWEKYKPLRAPQSVVGVALNAAQKPFLLKALASNPRWQTVRWCAEAALNCGMRSEEFKGLRLAQLHFDGAKPSVHILRCTTKTDAGERRVPLNQVAAFAFARLQELAALMGAVQPHHYLLPGNRSKHTAAIDPLKGGRGIDVEIPRATWRTAWRRAVALACETAKATGLAFPATLRFHDLRHTFITDLAERGVPIAVCQEIVGHMSTEMVRYYTHICDSAMRDAVNALNALNVDPTDQIMGREQEGVVN